MKPIIYIDGQAGTTGLQIYQRLGDREDITLLSIDPSKRKDAAERKKLLNAADLVFLCLPDAASVEAVSLIDNPNVRVIDASTAHRTNPAWTYGFSELSAAQKDAIRTTKRLANPGCHATGFISSTAPLVQAGIIPTDYPMTCYSLTGYSGGGKGMIAEYEDPEPPYEFFSPRIYGLTLNHKHLPEMQAVSGLDFPPVFCPIVDNYYKGMATTILLQNRLLPGKPTAENIWEALKAHYDGCALVSVAELGYDQPMIAANTMADKDSLQLIVCGGADRTTVTALFDSLGKGASGAAVQNMNLMLGFDETAGLAL